MVDDSTESTSTTSSSQQAPEQTTIEKLSNTDTTDCYGPHWNYTWVLLVCKVDPRLSSLAITAIYKRLKFYRRFRDLTADFNR
jgi:hypothetical protein